MRELAAEKLYEQARAWTAIGAQQTHAIEKHQQIEEVDVFERRRGHALRLLFLDLVKKSGERGVKALAVAVRR